jgi:hypothetical protein
MLEAQQKTTRPELEQLAWLATLGYAALAGLGWLMFGMARLLYWRTTQANIAAAETAGDLVLADRGRAFAGSLAVEMGFGFVAAAIFGFVAVALARRSWNAWDHATLVIGFTTVLTAVLVCARGRVFLFLPLSTAPLWLLLYLPWTKAACGVGKAVETTPEPDAPPATLSRAELEREIVKERTLIAQLAQNLDVFEVERSMDTDVFVRRYSEGLEEENADNAEWFAIARAVRRSRERIAMLTAQLEELPADA